MSFKEIMLVDIVSRRFFPDTFDVGLNENGLYIEKSIRNIPNIKVTDINHFSAFDIVKFKKIVFTESSLKELEKRYI